MHIPLYIYIYTKRNIYIYIYIEHGIRLTIEITCGSGLDFWAVFRFFLGGVLLLQEDNKGTLLGTPNMELQEYSRNIMEYKDPGRYIPIIYLLYSWGSRFGVPNRVPSFEWPFVVSLKASGIGSRI